jgi:hypothetical protein
MDRRWKALIQAPLKTTVGDVSAAAGAPFFTAVGFTSFCAGLAVRQHLDQHFLDKRIHRQGWCVGEPHRSSLASLSSVLTTCFFAIALSGVFAFDKLQYEDSLTGRRTAMNEISDHRPTYAVFRTSSKDDDGKSMSSQRAYTVCSILRVCKTHAVFACCHGLAASVDVSFSKLKI